MVSSLARCVLAALLACLVGTVACAQGKADLTGEPLTDDVRTAIVDALPEEPVADTPLEARRQARRAAEIARNALNANAYFAAEVTPRVIGDDTPKPAIEIVPGPQFMLGTIRIAYTDTASGQPAPGEIVSELQISETDIALPENVIGAEMTIVDALRERGFAFAKMEARDVVGDRDDGTIAVTYRVETGARIAFGEVRYPDGISTKTSYLRRLEAFERGETFAPGPLDRFNARLADTRLFDMSRASLADTPSGTTEDGRAIHDIEVVLEERERNTLGLGASVSTDRGFGVNAELTRRNLSRRGDIATASLTVAQLERVLDLRWERPHEFGYGRGVVLAASLAEEETDAFDRLALEASAGSDVRTGPDFTYSYGVQGSLVRETARVSLSEDRVDERDLQLFNLYGAASLDKADSVLDPREGWRAELRLEPTVALGGASSQFLRAIGQLRGYLPLDDDKRTVLAGRLRMGTAFGASLGDLPTDRRFYAGGGGSVRGYAYQSIGPRTPGGTPLGGRSLLEIAGELRWQWRERIGLVAFIDAGAVSDDETFGFEELRSGVGFGVRYNTVAGPIRADIGVPLDKTRFDDPFQVYLSIGQAF